MWRTVKLGDVCDFQGGSQPPKKEFVFEPQDGYIRFLQIRDFKSDKNVTFIPISKKNRLCNTDDILIGRYGASVGQILRGLEGAYNVALMKTIPNVEMISKGWLYSYLNSPLFQKPLMEVSSRSAQNGFSKDDISGFELPLPPLAEQQRIVAKLDAAFAEIDIAIQKQDERLKEANKLKATMLVSQMENQSWQKKKLNDVCVLRNGRAYKKPELLDKGKYPVLRVGNFFTSDKWYYSDLELDETKYCDSGDLLYAWSASFGARIWDGGKVIYHYHIWRVDADNTKIDKRFLFYWFEYDKEKVKAAHGTGTTMMHVSKGSMEKRDISLPNLSEQAHIVQRLDASFDLLEVRIKALQKSKDNYIRLKSAILAREVNRSEAA